MKTFWNIVRILAVFAIIFVGVNLSADYLKKASKEKELAESQALNNNPNSGINARIDMGPVPRYEPEENGIVSYGGGVYYFAHTGAEFGRHLAMFRLRYAKSLAFEGMAPHTERRERGSDWVYPIVGYWVTFRSIEK